jgi:hypothetical protein
MIAGKVTSKPFFVTVEFHENRIPERATFWLFAQSPEEAFKQAQEILAVPSRLIEVTTGTTGSHAQHIVGRWVGVEDY